MPHLANEDVSWQLRDNDNCFAEFALLLIKASISGEWPKQFNEKSLGGFAPLIAKVTDQVEFNKFLPEYLDFRWANSFGWDHVNAKRKRSTGEEGSVFGGLWWGVMIPFELYILKSVFESTSGGTIHFDTDHPAFVFSESLLSSCQHGGVTEETDFTTRLKSIAEDEFGIGWDVGLIASE
ncbi:hypothetical protein [Paraferrimonas sp. SM1919]|uniref:hypothetical protein n=1 Tax=Paraferrimonas sp. SM1919 TaxID=2662263 RepID=UPI0013D681FB|nr:hypothetical protein [Paraferrimonas sp. SM1919]